MTAPQCPPFSLVVLLAISDPAVKLACLKAFAASNIVCAEKPFVQDSLTECCQKFQRVMVIHDDFDAVVLPDEGKHDACKVFRGFVYLNRELFLDKQEVSQFDFLLPIEDDFEFIVQVIAQKIATDHFFGIGMLSQNKMDITENRILSSTARADCRQKIMAHVAGLSQQVNRPLDGFAQFAAEIQEELLMNALWDANPKMSSADRRTPIQLAEHEAVTTQWGFDGEIFYFSVRDPFGTFATASLDKYKRFLFCSDKINAVRVQQDGAGAGIGLYMVIERLSSMIVTVKPGVATEIVAMLRLGQSPRFVAKRDKSFQHFCI